MIRASEAGSL